MRFFTGMLWRLTIVNTVLLCGASALADTPASLTAERLDFHMENDATARTDNQYSAGGKLSVLYSMHGDMAETLKLPLLHDPRRTQMVSFLLAHQIYTPEDTRNPDLVPNDRPYAGWLYFGAGRHQASSTQLDSLTLTVGIIGKLSGAQAVQSAFHRLTGKTDLQGWDHQLDNEPGIILSYHHKWRFTPEPFERIETDIIPFIGGNLGNVHTDMSAGATLRIGRNIPEDFGLASIDIGGENGIPIHNENKRPALLPSWCLLFHISLSGSAVARNIFLDGNTFSDSHSVDKHTLVGSFGYGVSIRHKHYTLAYTHLQYTKQYTTEPSQHKIGTLVFSYRY